MQLEYIMQLNYKFLIVLHNINSDPNNGQIFGSIIE